LSKVRSKAGGSAVDLLAAILDTARSSSADARKWCWVIDNRMPMYGEVDPNRYVVRINVEKHRRERALLIDTLVHEELHILFPRFGEAMICAMTERRVRSIRKKTKTGSTRGSEAGDGGRHHENGEGLGTGWGPNGPMKLRSQRRWWRNPERYAGVQVKRCIREIIYCGLHLRQTQPLGLIQSSKNSAS
jgi:hypothetical protein